VETPRGRVGESALVVAVAFARDHVQRLVRPDLAAECAEPGASRLSAALVVSGPGVALVVVQIEVGVERGSGQLGVGDDAVNSPGEDRRNAEPAVLFVNEGVAVVLEIRRYPTDGLAVAPPEQVVFVVLGSTLIIDRTNLDPVLF
jgi:hypothetical protein